MTLYQDGVFAGSKSGHSPATMTRTHYIGRSNWPSYDCANANIAYVRVYNSLALTATDAATLFTQRYDCRSGMYGGNGSCMTCPAGRYSAISGATDRTACKSSCAAGSYSAAEASSCTPCAAGYYSIASSQSRSLFGGLLLQHHRLVKCMRKLLEGLLLNHGGKFL